GPAQRAERVKEVQDVVLLVGGEGEEVHTRADTAGKGGVVHSVLAGEPGGEGHALVVLDVLGAPEAEVLQVLRAGDDVGVDLVEVVEPYQRTGAVELVVPGQPLDVVDLVEELVGEAERVLHPDGVADAADEALLG